MRLVHMVQSASDILPSLANVRNLTLKEANSSFHNLKLDKKSSYLTTFVYQFGRSRYVRLPFGAAPAGNMFQRKIAEKFKNIPNIFGIPDDLLVVGYNGSGMDMTNHKRSL